MLFAKDFLRLRERHTCGRIRAFSTQNVASVETVFSWLFFVGVNVINCSVQGFSTTDSSIGIQAAALKNSAELLHVQNVLHAQRSFNISTCRYLSSLLVVSVADVCARDVGVGWPKQMRGRHAIIWRVLLLFIDAKMIRSATCPARTFSYIKASGKVSRFGQNRQTL